MLSVIEKNSNRFSKIIKQELLRLSDFYFKSKGLEGILAASIVSRHEILRINWKYRGKMKCTDILSFPSSLSASEHERFMREQYLNIKIYGKNYPIQFGHLIICPNFILKRFYKSSDWRLKLKLRKYLVHGFAHLCHFDHHSYKEYIEMRRFESDLKRALSIV